MREYFVPYAGPKPAVININGHNLVIVSPDKEELLEHLTELGGDSLRGIDIAEEQQQEDQVLQMLSLELDG